MKHGLVTFLLVFASTIAFVAHVRQGVAVRVESCSDQPCGCAAKTCAMPCVSCCDPKTCSMTLDPSAKTKE